MKISKRYEPIVFGVLMAAGMSFFMSGAMLLIKAGVGPGFFAALAKEWALGFVISLLPSMLLPPLIARLLQRFVRDDAQTRPADRGQG